MSDAAITLSKEEQAVIDALTKLNVIQLNNVVKYMEKTYGISAGRGPGNEEEDRSRRRQGQPEVIDLQPRFQEPDASRAFLFA